MVSLAEKLFNSPSLQGAVYEQGTVCACYLLSTDVCYHAYCFLDKFQFYHNASLRVTIEIFNQIIHAFVKASYLAAAQARYVWN